MTTHAGPWGTGDRFPQTRRSVLLAARDADPAVRRQAWDALAAGYWKPIYKLLRTRWRLDREDAEDLTQEFFATALVKGTFERYDPARARFRTYLRTCLDSFAANERKAARRLKRGGGQAPQTRPQIVGIVIGSMIKGLIAGVLIGWFSRKVNSLPLGILFGLGVGGLLAYLVVRMGNPYFWEIMLPGMAVGIIIGFATQRHAERPVAPKLAS